MENDNMEEWESAYYLSKKLSRLYEANCEEKKKVQDISKENAKLKQRIKDLENELKGKQKRNKVVVKEGPEADKKLIGVRIANENKSEHELNVIRTLFIKYFESVLPSGHFGVKRIGELDYKPFDEAMKFPKDNQNEALKKWKLWRKCLRDPLWKPFKVVNIQGKPTKIVDENDNKLKRLKVELGENINKAVKTALTEMSEYKYPGGRFIITELWNFEKNCKASLTEVVEFMINRYTPLGWTTKVNNSSSMLLPLP
ncbi:hypothetical protein F8388_023184 [Cannabis sativa]|uniref:Factor of DNA methylation 1-5/IDN2 domain-containing protein n=1 Tax=Cannabis sativa TaxID=3483 RepID=A0A7J6HG29_CANSA|nr:hypothetical protein F8388_023184 [Cannabis sativa]